jgi:hypothetical protein
MFSMFKGKDTNGSGVMHWSMTRVVAFMFAVTMCTATIMYARSGKEIGWPFCVLGVVTVLAVPLQGLFDYIQKWFTSSPGQKLLRELLAKVSGMAMSAGGSTTVKSEITTGGEAGV